MAKLRVRYSCLFITLFFVSGIIFGQNPGKEIKVNWLSPDKIRYNSKETTVLNFETAVYLFENNQLPALELPIFGNVTSINIQPLGTEEFTSAEVKLLPSSINIEHRIFHGYLSGKPVSFIYIIPITSQNGGYSKITSFSYTYQASSVPNSSNTAFKTTASVTSSVLSSGDWYKLSVPNTGLYKIDYNSLKQFGINPDQIDPRNIRIFGNGGGMLPQLNSDFRYEDLTENAITVTGENDGSFDNGDYILFYAQGPHTWEQATNGRFTHNQNIYADYAYYFLTVGDSFGKRISGQASPSGGAGQTITIFDERVFHEADLENVNISGREWYGEKFDYDITRNFSFDLPGIVTNSPIYLTSFVFGRSASSCSFDVRLNGSYLGNQSMGGVDLNYNLAKRGFNNVNTYNRSFSSSLSSLNVEYTFNKGSYAGAVGYLNYIEINLKRDLKLYNTYTAFRASASTSSAITEYVIGNAQNGMQLWDVTNPLVPESINYTITGTDAVFLANSDKLKEYIVFTGNSYNTPGFVGKVKNQNLHGIGTSDVPALIIVTTPAFRSSAERFAQFRRTNDNMKVEVVTVDDIYNEFSSGAQDITAIRDFVKMVYFRSTVTDSLKYLLLFGACSYDYKNRIIGNNNYVPVYESIESLDPIDSHSSDDYYGFFDPTEGGWPETGVSIPHTMEIGIGRFSVRNTDEAEAMVNKIIHYTTSNDCMGKWRNLITFWADDGDGNLHLIHADAHATKINSNYPLYNINKVYLDAYPQVSYPGGETSPQVKELVNQSIEKGSLIVNYVGHGGEQQLSQEAIFEMGQIAGYSNFNNLPFFITATCEFGRYDAPSRRSGAEYLLVNPNGGAIGMISSTRPVYADKNYILNSAVYDNIFKPINGAMPRLGDVMKNTKNQSSKNGIYNRNYALLADPTMKLAYAKEDAAVIKINGNTSPDNDTLRALGLVKIEGQINDKSGSLMSGYTGEVNITVYDKESIITTFGTQESYSTTFKMRNNFIYAGTASVAAGKFSLEFIVPKDISYQYDIGKISMYSMSPNQKFDAAGYNYQIVIGGTDASAKADSVEPLVNLYMNDESFVFGGLTSPNSLFLARLSDDNGINVAGQGIGHEITAILDDNKEVLVLNEFYSPKKDSYKEGYVRYPMKNLSPGNHSLKFKCWDTYNNSAEKYLEFVVANDEKIALQHVLNYPNPFSTNTTFHFDHNRAGDELDVLVSIYTISGKLIKTLETRAGNSNTHFSDLSWDGRDDFGDKIGKGVYVYKVSVRSVRDGSEVSKFEKLVLLN